LFSPRFAAEESRIRDAYSRRDDGARYAWMNPGHLFLLHERERRTLALLARSGFADLDGKRVLAVGCGRGTWLRSLIQWGARPELTFGVDLLPERIAEARRLCPAGVQLRCGNAADLEFPSGIFDLVLQSAVFTSILDPTLKRRIASEMLRVLRPGGMVLWYDYHVDNPANPDVRGVGRREIETLFAGCPLRLERITLLPPMARRLAPRSWLLCQLLERVPWLCTHYLGAIRQPGPSPAGFATCE